MIGSVLRDIEALQAAAAAKEEGVTTSFFTRAHELCRVLANDSTAVLLLWRIREAALHSRVPLVNTLLRRMQTVMFGIEIERHALIGEGVWFVHTVGTVVGGDSRVGNRVRLMGGNTIGTNLDDGYPSIGDDAVIGVGARVLGPVRIGEGARIGAGSVVLSDVPAGAVAVGVPAKIISSRHAG